MKFMIVTLKSFKKFNFLKLIAKPIFRRLPVGIKSKILTKANVSISVSERNSNALFIHIPKNAGKAMYKCLFGEEHLAHNTAMEYLAAYPSEFEKYTTICIVRNPWDRFVSAYHYLEQGAGNGAYGQQFAKYALSQVDDFESFVKKANADKAFQKKLLSWDHFRPQYEYITNQRGDLIVDEIGRFEELEKFYSHVVKKLNIDAKTSKLVKVNASSRKAYQSYYTEETKAIIGSMYKADIHILRYEF